MKFPITKHGSLLALLLGVAAATLSPGSLHAKDHPLSSRADMGLSKAEQLPMLSTPGADNVDLQARHPFDSASPVMRFAESMRVKRTPSNSGRWERVTMDGAGDYRVWRLVVRSPGAVSISIGFSKYRLPDGAELFVYAPGGTGLIGPFTAQDNDAHGQLWTPLVRGDTAIIELNIPYAQGDDFELEIGSINHGFRTIGRERGSAVGEKALTGPTYKSGSCNADVVCPQGDPWRPQIRAVAIYVIEGTTVCSGAAVNNTRQDGRPYFLTADHCGITAQNAASMVVYWNYQNSFCRAPGSIVSGNPGDGELTQFNTGAMLRASFFDADTALVELDDPIDPSYDIFLAGWDNRSQAPTMAATIHHPAGEEKRISLDNDAVTVTGEFVDEPAARTHLRVGNWEIGATEPGSSGAPLFNQDGRIVGQLTGGSSACGNQLPDWFGRLHLAWDGAGTSGTRLSTWLDPDGTGATYIDGMRSQIGSFMPAIYHLLLLR